MKVERVNRLDHLTDKERQVAAEFVERMRQRFDGQLLSAVLFGSRARGDATEDADMDVLVVLEDFDPAVLDQVRAIRYEVMRRHRFRPLISLLVLSARDWQELSRHSAGLKHNIEREGIILWSRT